MIKIIIHNHKSRLVADAKTLDAVRNKMKIKAKNYFWSEAWRKRQWDGYVQYVTEKGGIFDTGLLHQIGSHLRKMKKEFEIIDQREKFKSLYEIDGLAHLTSRNDQIEALEAILNNRVEGIKFPRGIMAEATNYGKSLLGASLYASYSDDRRGIFLINSKTLFLQAVDDLQKLLGKDQVGWVSSEKGVKWARITICMVQTLGSRIKKDPSIRNELAKQDIIVIDEYDEVIGRKDTKDILQSCHNAYVRIGLTGSELLSKDKNKNQEQLKFTGPVIHKTSNKELVDLGVSTPPNIKFIMGNEKPKNLENSWQQENLRCVIKNRKLSKKVWRVAERAINKGPLLILFKHHLHAQKLMEVCPPQFQDQYRIRVIHGKVEGREGIMKQFNNGKVDILVASMIIKRGKNLPLIRTLINVAGGDSHANIKQIFGRALRKDKSKEEVDIIEFYHLGRYLEKHSKHRIQYYKAEKFPVKELYINKLKTIRAR